MEGESMGIECFVSGESLRIHKEHLSALRMKKEICTTQKEREDLAVQIRSHELYFSSFRRERVPCERVRAGYRSENDFCFELSEYAQHQRFGFLYIYPMARYPFVGFGTEEKNLARAALALDLWEHAYFLDYGFDYISYLKAALSHLDFSRLKQ